MATGSVEHREAARMPSRRDVIVTTAVMLLILGIAAVPVRLIAERIIADNLTEWPFNPAVTRIAGMAITRLLEVLAVLLALALLFRLTRYGSFAALGMGRSKLKWLPIGILVPLIALPLAALIAYALGWLPVTRLLFPGPWPLFLVFAASVHAAVIEEIGFRGILMQGIEGVSNRVVAVILSGLLFAGLHLLAPFDLTWPWWITVVAAGLGFGWAFYAAGRSLWLTIGLHFGFDMGVFLLLGLPGETRGWLHWADSGPNPALSPQAGSVMLIGLLLTAAPLLLMLRRTGRGAPPTEVDG
jgi:membrane protease YdiL (CAAX protease family)